MRERVCMNHHPVLLEAFLEAVQPKAGEVWLDATFGRGGHSGALLERGCRVYAMDQDAEAEVEAGMFREKWGEVFTFIRGNFRGMKDVLEKEYGEKIDGVLMDLGLSSPQITSRERGFSFMGDGPLDMRMDQRGGMTAADVLNTWSEEDLANVIYKYGDERRARVLAREVVARRLKKRWERTGELVDLTLRILGRPRADRVHPATRFFQAIRIAVNDELGALEEGLLGAVDLLKAGGRLAVISFHSGEDRLVKQFMKSRSLAYAGTWDGEREGAVAVFSSVKRWLPTDVEVKENPRARSARLRVAYKIGGGDE
jgi:16S rRNA (cytosine1402-N4)-methyltransferase